MIALFLAFASVPPASAAQVTPKAQYESCIKQNAERMAKAKAEAGDIADAAIAACRVTREKLIEKAVTRRPSWASIAKSRQSLVRVFDKLDIEMRRVAILEVIKSQSR